MLSTIANIFNGDSINEQEKAQKYYGQAIGYNYIGTKDVNFNHTINYNNGVKIPYDTSFKIAHKNTPLLCIEGGSAGRKIGILEEDVCFGNKLCAFETYSINSVYLFYFLQCSEFVQIFKHNTQGIIGGVSINTIKKLPFLLPPLEEQARIVKRIEELFVQIDIIDQNQADIDTLYEEFRKRTLTLAIQGKLVPQDPNDEPASVLLERIRAEKKVKLDKKYVDSYIYKGDDNCYYEHIAGREQDELVEVPFDIPYGWSWCRLAIFAQVLGGKRIPAGRQLTNENTGHYYIKVSDMKENTVCLDKLQFVPTDIYPTISRYIINKEDVYITVAGTIGRVGTIPNELDGANLTENADRIVIDEIDQHWLVKCLLSDVIQEQIKEATTKVGQPKLAIARIEKFLIPLPPLAEQKRIVAKINEIFTML